MEDTLIEAIDIYHLRDCRGVGFVKRGLNHICQDAVYFIAKPPGFIVADGVTNPAAKSVSQMVHLVCMRLLELIDHYPSLSIVYAIEVANSFIRVINENENPDERLGMVLSIALIDKENESVEISWVGDCGIQVLDEENHLRLQSIDQVSAASQYLDSLGFRAAVDRRCYAQKHIRNNPYACDRDGKCIGFGVLDGDTRAASFISQKSISISKGWRVLGY